MVFGGVMEALSAVTTIAEKIFSVIKKVHKHYHYCQIPHVGLVQIGNLTHHWKFLQICADFLMIFSA